MKIILIRNSQSSQEESLHAATIVALNNITHLRPQAWQTDQRWHARLAWLLVWLLRSLTHMLVLSTEPMLCFLLLGHQAMERLCKGAGQIC